MKFASLARRRALLALAALAALPAVHAEQAWPARTITLVHPYAAGGPADTMARALAQQLSKRLNETVIVDAKPGGAATIGTGFVARARPDGYTFLISTSAGHVVTPLMQKVPYDGIADFAFIAVVASQPNVLVANPSVPANSLQELIALARKEPGVLNYASAGTGGATHLGAEAFAQAAKIRITHVPYNGAAPALKDVLGGQVQLGMLNLAATRPFIAEGKLKALAYGGAQRTPLLPGVPTLAEAGYGNTATATWYTLAAPKGTPPQIIETMRKAFADVSGDAEWQKVLASQGAEQINLSPAQTTAFVQQDKAAMRQLLGTLGLLEEK
ncbi:tripartite tricarboxylate transporter substrate binding protein [Ramlibacter sp. G-1-2-2]|uniref:Tripartite tricarboxylate transporter substrate binding protein n=1 Tax=Ramlibacter agri TaxID=2728837 RepID=A0A848HAX5_9BURK|nr:tripartite tricarboxylate transporter substrate binding protein [Ramlibacter agri]NML47607.1 tripartite tricarboxylate transporter substrate binding protein [Ramlibacter agri]